MSATTLNDEGWYSVPEVSFDPSRSGLDAIQLSLNSRSSC